MAGAAAGAGTGAGCTGWAGGLWIICPSFCFPHI